MALAATCTPVSQLQRASRQRSTSVACVQRRVALGPSPAVPQLAQRQQLLLRCAHAGNRARNLVVHAKRATEEDEKLIEDMKLAVEKGDAWEGGLADAFVKVLVISLAAALVITIGFLGKPMFDNTISAFPSAESSR